MVTCLPQRERERARELLFYGAPTAKVNESLGGGNLRSYPGPHIYHRTAVSELTGFSLKNMPIFFFSHAPDLEMCCTACANASFAVENKVVPGYKTYLSKVRRQQG